MATEAKVKKVTLRKISITIQLAVVEEIVLLVIK